MRMAGECFQRGRRAAEFTEEGRGLGFSIGGWHPFRINTYLPTIKKLDPLANTAIGKAVWKPIEKVDRFQAQKFQVAKKWAQDHRKQLQIAAAIAAAMVGGAFALGYLGTGAAAGAGAAGAAEGVAAGAAAAEGAAATAATAAAAEGAAATAATTAAATTAAEAAALPSVVATTSYTAEALAPIAIGTNSASVAAASASGLSLAPATASAVTATEAATAGSILSKIGSGVSTAASYGKTALTGYALLSSLTGKQAQPQPDVVPIYGAGGFQGGYTGGGYSGGGGGLGPAAIFGQETPAAPAAPTVPPWVLPAAGAALLVLLLKDR